MPTLKSVYRFPYNFTREYLRPKHYWYFGKACYERVRFGVSHEDEYSLDYHLASVILRSILNYKNDDKYGERVVYVERYNDDFSHNESDMELWDMKIDAIWSAFYDLYESDDIALQYSAEASERFQHAFRLFGELFRGLWW